MNEVTLRKTLREAGARWDETFDCVLATAAPWVSSAIPAKNPRHHYPPLPDAASIVNAQCWCRRILIRVPLADVRQGLTRPCRRHECKTLDELVRDGGLRASAAFERVAAPMERPVVPCPPTRPPRPSGFCTVPPTPSSSSDGLTVLYRINVTYRAGGSETFTIEGRAGGTDPMPSVALEDGRLTITFGVAQPATSVVDGVESVSLGRA